VKAGEENLILAKARLGVLSGDYKVVDELPGEKLQGKKYEPVFPFFESTPGAFKVETADFVTMEDGTGIVHIAPALGEDDYNLGREKGLPVLQPVDERGRFTAEVTRWANVFVKDADKEIIQDLKARGLLYKEETVVHSYPYCWRCDSPLIYYARKSWNIRTTSYKDLMIKCNSAVEWYPRDIGVSRFGNWIENNVDWALSRDRYWGTPLNIWICEKCSEEVSVGSIEELKKLGAVLPPDLDLHKPMVDEFVLKCPCGGEMKRTPEVIDCWFDSGSMPYAQWHYPFENVDKFQKSFPADFISEGMDQSRGWFYSLLAISSFISGESSFKSVIPIEMILDKNGQRMSKSKGNAAEPTEILDKEGADALRWYLLTTSPPWIPTKFDREGVTEVASKLLGTLRNTCQFFSLYANIDGFKPSCGECPGPVPTEKSTPTEKSGDYELSLIDRWVISRLNTLTRQVRSDMKGYEITRAARAIQDFVIEDLSNWYIRRCRRRFWKSELGPDKIGAYETLYSVLVNVAKLLAPFAPFVSEEIHQKIARVGEPSSPESVHLCDFPQFDECAIDGGLEERMHTILRVISVGRALRNDAKIRTRQPLRTLALVGRREIFAEALDQFDDLVQEELNVKNVQIDEDLEKLKRLREEAAAKYVGKPKFGVLGPRLGKRMNEAIGVIQSLGQESLRRIYFGETIQIEISGVMEALSSADVEVTQEELTGFGLALANRQYWMGKDRQSVFAWGDKESNWGVRLDTTITDELRHEGIVREFVHRLQSLRKTADLDVSDRIVLCYEAGPGLSAVLQAFESYIASEALAQRIEQKLPGTGAMEEWALDGEKVKVAVKKAD